MKNKIYSLVKMSLVLLAFIGFVSCDSTDDDTSFLNDRTSVSYFVPGSSGTLLVQDGITSTYDIKVGISEPKSFDRAFTYTLDPSSTAVLGTDFTVSSTLTVPANSIVGTISVTGDYGASTLAGKTAKFNLVSVEDAVLGARKMFTLTIQRFCPVASDYLIGDYEISDVNAQIGPGNGTSNFAPGVVTITANGPTSRTWMNSLLPAFVPAPKQIVLDLICGSVILQDRTTGLQCTSGVPYIYVGAGASNSAYDDNDDSFLIVNYTEDPNGSCGGPFLSSFSLTKL
ncbi:MAG: hypothetical protein R2783_06340 [Gelidibacter sp.]